MMTLALDGGKFSRLLVPIISCVRDCPCPFHEKALPVK